jgi:hypothetical protein
MYPPENCTSCCQLPLHPHAKAHAACSPGALLLPQLLPATHPTTGAGLPLRFSESHRSGGAVAGPTAVSPAAGHCIRQVCNV